MKTTVLIGLAAIAASGASVIFLAKTAVLNPPFTAQQIFPLTLIVMVLWSPSNVLFLWGLKESGDMSNVYVKFCVGMAITDALGGIFLLSQMPNNIALFIAGLLLGLAVLAWGSKHKKEVLAKSALQEMALYVTTGAILYSGYVTSNLWVLLAGYVFADVTGGVLSLRLSGLLEKHLKPAVTNYVSSLLGFSPVSLAAVLLLLNFRILPIIGPVSAIGVIVFVGIVAAVISSARVNWGRFLALAAFGAISVALIFLAW